MNDLIKLITELNDQACEKNLRYVEEYGQPWAISTDGDEIIIKFYGAHTALSVSYAHPNKKDLLDFARSFVNAAAVMVEKKKK